MNRQAIINGISGGIIGYCVPMVIINGNPFIGIAILVAYFGTLINSLTPNDQ